MLSEYHENGVITGPLDSFCLICEGYLKTVEDINKHVEKPVHKKNLDAAPYLDKFKDEYIRKVKKGYYCQFCNLLFSTAAKVCLHINEKQHKHSKGSQLLKRDNNGVLAFGNVLISDTAWNGIIEETCVICNAEFDDESMHRTEQSHVLNLIQSKLEFYDKSMYRKIDDSSFQCLTCNVVFAADTFTVHFELSDHKVAYQKCCENASKSRIESINISTIEVNKKEKKEEKKKDEKVQTKSSKPQIAVTTSVNEQTNETKKNKTDKEIKSEKKNLKVSPEEIEKQFCESVGANNYLCEVDAGHYMCILCEWTIGLPGIVSHMHGQHHLTMLKMHKERLKNMNSDDTSETKETKTKETKTKETKTKEAKTKETKVKEEPHIDNDSNNKILGAVTEFQDNDIKINFEFGTAVCKKCTSNLDFNFEAIDSHIQNHKRQLSKTSSESKIKSLPETQNKKEGGKSTTQVAKTVMTKRKDDVKDKQISRASSVSSRNEEDLMEFALQHDLQYKNAKMFCNVCQSKVPANLKNMKEHVEGSTHKSKLAEQSAVALVQDKPIEYKLVSVKEYIQDIAQVKTTFLDDIVINRKICINIVSFLMIVTFECECCGVRLNLESVDDHKLTPKHLLAMTDAKVLDEASLKSEFIREARPGVFHCGFCNIALPTWNAMEEHLASILHKESKNSAHWRLQQHLPDVNRHSVVRQMRSLSAFMTKLNNNSFGSDNEW